jgi:fatty-acyl-CoA synthase
MEPLPGMNPHTFEFLVAGTLGGRTGWLDYETLLDASDGDFPRSRIEETHLIAINYTSGTTTNPKGVMITHRDAWINATGTLTHWPMTLADRYLWAMPMFHANGWTFARMVAAVARSHIRLRKVDAGSIYAERQRERVTTLCAAPTVPISIANGREEQRRRLTRGVRLLRAGALPDAATIERIEGDLGWQVIQVYSLTETSPFIAICEPLTEHDRKNSAQRGDQGARRAIDRVGSRGWWIPTCKTCRTMAAQ